MHDISEFQIFFNSRLRERGLTLRKVAELTGINLKHLEYMSAGNFDDLPPAPYFRGYLFKLSGVLSFDPEEWWEVFRTSKILKSSGVEDELPKNRFVRRSYGRLIFPVLGILVVALYLGFRSSAIIGEPTLTITEPSENPTTVTQKQFTVRGTLKGGEKVVVGGTEIPISPDGAWAAPVLLEAGLNTVEIRAKKLLGREINIVRHIIYVPPPATTTEESAPEL